MILPKSLHLIVNKYIKKHPSGTIKQYYLTDEGVQKAEELFAKQKKEGNTSLK